MKLNKEMPSASGLLFNDVSSLIEKVARQKACQYRNIGFFDYDDIMQEVRIKCWRVLHKYNPHKFTTDLSVFLSICAENRMRDIRRSIVYKHNRPCIRCPFWNQSMAQSGIHDCLIFLDKMQCDKYNKHERYVQAKLSASHPVDIDNQRIIDNKSDQHINEVEIIDYVLSNIDKDLLPAFKQLLANNFEIRKVRQKDRALLVKALKEILLKYRSENE